MAGFFNKSFTDGKWRISNLGVSRHKAVHVVVDLLEYKASVHEGEAALWKSLMDLVFAFKSELLAQNLHSQRCGILMLYPKPKSTLLRLINFIVSGEMPTLMNTAKLWLALRAASRLSLYFWVMCGISIFTRVSTAW